MGAVVDAIGVLAPGLPDWQTAGPILAGRGAYEAAPVGRVRARALPRLEARRATDTVHLAVATAEQALGSDRRAEVPAVFASADGDLETVERMCRSVADAQPWVSPHRFHNSVHNAPSGYWSIAAGCRAPSVTVSAGDATFAAGLLETLAILAAERPRQCLLVAYDQAAPAAFAAVHPVASPFAVALLLSRSGAGPSLRVAQRCSGGAPSTCEQPELEALRRRNPAARALPLLVSLATGTTDTLGLPGTEGTMQLELEAAR